MYSNGVPLRQRLSDLARICNKLNPVGRRKFLDAYVSTIGMRFAWYLNVPFFLYDGKVWLKRKLGRKAIKRFAARVADNEREDV
jgi:hypothetical protein